jgi:nicotinamidase-related amidase
MKAAYFTFELLDQQALAIYQDITARSPRRRAIRFNPRHSALLILDMQAYFLDPSSHAYIPSANAILPGIKLLIQAYHKRNLPVIFTRHLNTPQNAGSMSTWWRDLIASEHPFSRIISELRGYEGEIIHKSQYDAFYNTGLKQILHNENVTQVVICGVMTHLCCETTARSAFVHGFDVIFPVDGSATYNEDYHRATLLNLSHGFATLTLVKDLIDSLQQTHED